MVTFEEAYNDLKNGEGLKMWQIPMKKQVWLYEKMFGKTPRYIDHYHRIVELMTVEEQYAVGLLTEQDIIDEYTNQYENDRE